MFAQLTVQTYLSQVSYRLGVVEISLQMFDHQGVTVGQRTLPRSSEGQVKLLVYLSELDADLWRTEEMGRVVRPGSKVVRNMRIPVS